MDGGLWIWGQGDFARSGPGVDLRVRVGPSYYDGRSDSMKGSRGLIKRGPQGQPHSDRPMPF